MRHSIYERLIEAATLYAGIPGAVLSYHRLIRELADRIGPQV